MTRSSAADSLPDELLTAEMVRKLTKVTDMSIWRWMKAGTFPKPMRIHRRNYWRMSDIKAWLASLAAAPAGVA